MVSSLLADIHLRRIDRVWMIDYQRSASVAGRGPALA
jgi:hypothetical protein